MPVLWSPERRRKEHLKGTLNGPSLLPKPISSQFSASAGLCYDGVKVRRFRTCAAKVILEKYRGAPNEFPLTPQGPWQVSSGLVAFDHRTAITVRQRRPAAYWGMV